VEVLRANVRNVGHGKRSDGRLRAPLLRSY
jgi:hypothetical protein